MASKLGSRLATNCILYVCTRMNEMVELFLVIIYTRDKFDTLLKPIEISH